MAQHGAGHNGPVRGRGGRDPSPLSERTVSETEFDHMQHLEGERRHFEVELNRTRLQWIEQQERGRMFAACSIGRVHVTPPPPLPSHVIQYFKIDTGAVPGVIRK